MKKLLCPLFFIAFCLSPQQAAIDSKQPISLISGACASARTVLWDHGAKDYRVVAATGLSALAILWYNYYTTDTTDIAQKFDLSDQGFIQWLKKNKLFVAEVLAGSFVVCAIGNHIFFVQNQPTVAKVPSSSDTSSQPQPPQKQSHLDSTVAAASPASTTSTVSFSNIVNPAPPPPLDQARTAPPQPPLSQPLPQATKSTTASLPEISIKDLKANHSILAKHFLIKSRNLFFHKPPEHRQSKEVFNLNEIERKLLILNKLLPEGYQGSQFKFVD
jgi:hypothetical protein